MGPPQRKRIVLVEDEPDLRELLHLALRKRYDVVAVAMGDAALDAVESHRPHLLILDIHIPHKNGFEISEQVRAKSHLKSIPILFLSGRSDAWSEARAKRAGGDGFMKKPFEVNALLARIEALTA